MKLWNKVLFIAIILIASLLRLWQLGSVPASPDWDEVALGYNAYSIANTGRDEYGNFLPLSIRSFDDYKPPLYVYLTVPSVAVFGLSVWSTRLPSVIFGILAVIGTFYLAREFSRLENEKSWLARHGEEIALVASGLLAVSPWNVHFSRIAFEANIGITLNIWAVFFFLRALRSPVHLVSSALLFGFAIWSYHSERLFVPLILLALLIIYREQMKVIMKRRETVAGVFVGALFLIPLIGVMFGGGGATRLKGTSWFSNPTTLLAESVEKMEFDLSRGDMFGSLFENRRFVFVKTFIDGYVSHFSPKWLFLTGDNARHHAPDVGLLYVVELPFLLYGFLRLNRGVGRMKQLLFAWMLLAPLPAAPTTGLPHAIRSMVFLPTFQIATAVGLIGFFDVLKNVRFRSLYSGFVVFVALLFAINIGYYLSMYWGRMDKEYSEFWQYGYKQAAEYTEEHKNEYKKVVVSTTLEQPYMFFLFYTAYDPAKYLAAGGTVSGGFSERNNAFDKYEFRKIDWVNELKDGSVLYVGSPQDIPHRFGSKITYLNGKPSIEIADRE